MENLSANNIVGKTIPHEYYTDTPDGNAAIMNVAKVQAFVDKVINPPKPTPSSNAPGSHTSTPSTSTSPKPIDAKCIN
jgi:hypothetical protein